MTQMSKRATCVLPASRLKRLMNLPDTASVVGVEFRFETAEVVVHILDDYIDSISEGQERPVLVEVEDEQDYLGRSQWVPSSQAAGRNRR